MHGTQSRAYSRPGYSNRAGSRGEGVGAGVDTHKSADEDAFQLVTVRHVAAKDMC
jgi:hypothetical protein